MVAELEPLYEAMADPERLADWRACVLGRRSDADGWRKLVASPVTLRRGPAVKVVRSIGRREEAETVAMDDWPRRLERLLDEPFDRIHVQTRTRDWHGRRSKRGRWLVSSGKPSAADAPRSVHDRERRYPLPADDERVRALFAATGLFGSDGRPRARASDKYRQVQHYVDLLRPLPVWERARTERRALRVVDAGCGKAYMSLALVLYGELQGVAVELVGLDRDREVVDSVRAIAADLGYDRARFEATEIGSYVAAAPPADLLVSLHACDTATDEAIAAGVKVGAEVIVLAPCCQHELARQLRDADGWEPVTRQPLLRRRLADVLTDGLRASMLEALGYSVDAIDFVAAEHTAKNLMLRAVRRDPPSPAVEARARAEYEALRDLWGLSPLLERLLQAF